MQGVNKRILSSLFLMLLACGASFAIDNEYKNSLTKIELSKQNDNLYNIDLYTQKKYQEPIKVIKKSDLNYYILLPETKNSASKGTAGLQDIKSISTNTYSYAGQESKNGYTKININTSKPVNFNINVKSQPNEKIINNNEAIANPVKNENLAEAQKKNLTKNIPSAPAPKKNDSLQSKEISKVSQEKTISKQVTSPKKRNEIQKPKVVQQIKKQENKIDTTEDLPQINENQNENPTILEDNLIGNSDFIVEEIDTAQDEYIEEDIEEIFEEQEIKNQNIVKLLCEKLLNKLIEYRIHPKCIFLALFILSGLVLFIALIIVLKNRIDYKRTSNKHFSNPNTGFSERRQRPKDKTKQQPNNGQYFVFDKNVVNNFYNPNDNNDEKKHYELSSYDPDIQVNYHKKTYEKYSKKGDNEYDIIQKILKEDSIIEYEPNKVEKVQNTPKPQVQKEPQKEEVQPPKEIAAPVVLSSVEIAPERGFMCVSYNDNINLIGYIFDDVYALHNFKQPKLENYDIKYRLSEKDEQGANFIVKVENTKMLIRVTKSFMTLEVLL